MTRALVLSVCAAGLSGCLPFSELVSVAPGAAIDPRHQTTALRTEISGALVPAGSRGVLVGIDGSVDPKSPISRSEARASAEIGYASLPVAFGAGVGGEALARVGGASVETESNGRCFALASGLRFGLPLRLSSVAAPWEADESSTPMLLLEPFADTSAVVPLPKPEDWRVEVTLGLALRVDFWSRVAP